MLTFVNIGFDTRRNGPHNCWKSYVCEGRCNLIRYTDEVQIFEMRKTTMPVCGVLKTM